MYTLPGPAIRTTFYLKTIEFEYINFDDHGAGNPPYEVQGRTTEE